MLYVTYGQGVRGYVFELCRQLDNWITCMYRKAQSKPGKYLHYLCMMPGHNGTDSKSLLNTSLCFTSTYLKIEIKKHPLACILHCKYCPVSSMNIPSVLNECYHICKRKHTYHI